jgi:hypothetical protein
MLFGRMASVIGIRVKGGRRLDRPPSASSLSMKDGRGERAFSGGRAVKVVELLSLYKGGGSSWIVSGGSVVHEMFSRAEIRDREVLHISHLP